MLEYKGETFNETFYWCENKKFMLGYLDDLKKDSLMFWLFLRQRKRQNQGERCQLRTILY